MKDNIISLAVLLKANFKVDFAVGRADDSCFDGILHTPMWRPPVEPRLATENPVNRKASRHIDTRKHFIGQLVEDKTIVLKQCPTEKVEADALTKGLPAPAFERHKAEMLGKSSNAC